MNYQTFVDEFSKALAASVPDQNIKAKELSRKLDMIAVGFGFFGVVPLIAGLPNYIPSVPLRAMTLIAFTAAALISLTLLTVSKSVSRLSN